MHISAQNSTTITMYMTIFPQRSSLMVILSDKTEDSEIRINTYLMLMHCPNMELVEQMKSLLDNEEINQVRSKAYLCCI